MDIFIWLYSVVGKYNLEKKGENYYLEVLGIRHVCILWIIYCKNTRINLISMFYLRKQANPATVFLSWFDRRLSTSRLTSAEVNYDVSLTQQSIAISTDFRFAILFVFDICCYKKESNRKIPYNSYECIIDFIYPIYVCG